MAGKNLFETKTLFKYLLTAYSFTLLFLLFWLQSGCFKYERDNAEEIDEVFHKMNRKNYEQTTKSNIEYIYRNVTSIVYVNQTVEKIVYEDPAEIKRFGPGENGAKLGSVNYNKDKMDGRKLNKLKIFNGFDTILSDTISVHRKMSDVRHQECKDLKYPDNMPAASVVIIFRDEWHSILLRTVYSVLELSPPELLKEIILVDDGSTDATLVAKVDLHVANVDKLKLVRNEKSLGLMMARQKGIDATTSDYFIVMDGHMEVGPGWIEPLIHRLIQEPNALLCSHIGIIQSENFEIQQLTTNFDFTNQFPFFDFFTLDQMWGYFSPEFKAARHRISDPVPYGTVQGMMIVMRKAYFYKLGGFDPGMKVWGTEQMELSIKVWRCGGRVEMIPCSKVAHMYRKTQWGELIYLAEQTTNKARTLEVWFDSPYKEYAYPALRDINFTIGDLTDRHRIREENNCKPFDYLIERIKQFSNVYLPVAPLKKGVIMNVFHRLCVDIADPYNDRNRHLILYGCHGNINQFFLLTEFNEIRFVGGRVLGAFKSMKSNITKINISKRTSITSSNEYKWRFENGHIYNVRSGLCLDAVNATLTMAPCSNATGDSQSWVWGYNVWL